MLEWPGKIVYGRVSCTKVQLCAFNTTQLPVEEDYDLDEDKDEL